ncbi:MAG: cysteine desulfurase family protein [Patescibacteria group bacterium]|nr:cysteine desulfurase family protein [Patescibacteria group bacterium]
MKRIYMDFAAATPVDPRVIEAMAPYWREHYGNPGAIHSEGVFARRAVERARSTVARALGARVGEIIFTANGTESNAIAIFGVIKRYEQEHGYDISGAHFITSTIEHPSVLEGFRELSRRGARVSYIDVDEKGRFDLKALEQALSSKTLLVSLMYVNNEVGTIEPIREAAKLIRSARKRRTSVVPQLPVTSYQPPYFHTDASQAPLWLKVNVAEFGVDLLTIDGQKIMGPKGVGALFIRCGTPVTHPLFPGGSQERGIRPGTEPVPLIVGLCAAFELAEAERENTVVRISALRDYFLREVLRAVPGARINGSREQRIANNVNISIPGYESEQLIIGLDGRGVAISARSACISGGEGSYVLRALGKSSREATSSLRFSLGPTVTREDVDFCVRTLAEIVIATPCG